MNKLEAALRYLEQGWSVIPLRANSKIPAVQWAEFQTRRATPEEVRQWWGQWPDANIGAITGSISGIIAVDIDPRHGGNAEPIHHANHTGLLQRTAGGGTHLIYSYPGGVDWIPNRTSVQPGVDIRADGGYIVVAPSEINGRPYTWIGKFSDIGKAPPRWSVERDTTAKGEVVEKWLSEAMQGVRDGERNDTMARIAGYMAAKEIPKDVALEFIRLWNRNNENPHTLTETEMEATISSVYRRARTRKKPSPNNIPSSGGSKKFSLMDLSTYANKYATSDMNWQIEGWLPAATIGFAVSPPGAFKTWLLLDAAVSVASGKPFLGHWKVPSPGPTVIIQQEDHHAAIASRVNTIIWSKFNLRPPGEGEDFDMPIPPQLPIYLHPNRALRFDDPDVVAAFVTAMREIKPKLVFIDPLYTAVSNENYMAEAAERMLVLKALRDELGTTFLIAHHTKKSGNSAEAGTDRADAWGSQFLNAFLETGWQIRTTQRKNAIRVLRHFKTSGAQEDIALLWQIQDDSYQYQVDEVNLDEVSSPNGTKADERITKVLEFLSEERTQRSIAVMLDVHPNICKRLLEKLREDGRIERDEETKKWRKLPDLDLNQLDLTNDHAEGF